MEIKNNLLTIKDKDRDKKKSRLQGGRQDTGGTRVSTSKKGGGCLLSRIALQYHRRKRA